MTDPVSRGRRARPWPSLVALCLGFFLLLLDSTIVAVAVPTIATRLDAAPADAVWVNSAYLFAYAVPLLIAGRLGDRFGARRIYLVGLVVFILASLACGLAPDLLVLVIARVVQGLGAALMTPQSLAIIRRTFPPRLLPRALGVWGGVGGVAAASGPLLGGVLVQAAGWPAIFLVNVPLGILVLVLVLVWVARPEHGTARIPVFTSVASAVGVFAVVFAVHEAAALGWLAVVLGGAGVVIVALAFGVQPRDSARALVPAALVRSRGFVVATVGATSASFIVGAALIPVMLHLQDERGLTVGTATLALVPLGVVSAVTAPLAGAGLARWGARPIACTGAIALVASTLACALLAAVDGPVGLFAVVFAVFGFANSFVWSPFAAAAITSVPPALAGVASGAYNATRQIGAVTGSAVAAAVMAAAGTSAALWTLGATGIVAVSAAIVLPRRAGAAPRPGLAADSPTGPASVPVTEPSGRSLSIAVKETA